MTPPRFIQNFVFGTSSSDWVRASELEIPVAAEAANAQRDEADSREILGDDARDYFLHRQPNRYGSSLRQAFESHPSATLNSYLSRLISHARSGDRRSFFDALRLNYTLLTQNSGEDRVQQVRQMISLCQEYMNHLEGNLDLNTEERFRYLFAAARITHAALVQLEVSSGENSALAEQSRNNLGETLRSMDGLMEGYYREMERARQDMEPFRGILLQVQLREALLERAPEEIHRFSREMRNYYLAHPSLLEDRTWPTESSRLLATDSEFLPALEQMTQASSAEENAVVLNGLGLEMLIAGAASLDQSNEESIETIRPRYRRLSAILTVMILARPEQTLSEILESLRNPHEGEHIVEELTSAQASNASLAELLREAQGSLGLVQLLESARLAADHLHALEAGPGQNILPRILEAADRHQAFHQISSLLRNQVSLCLQLGLGNGGPPSSGTAAARELLRRGAEGRQELQAYAETYPSEELQTLQRLLREDGSSEVLSQFGEDLLTNTERMLDSAPDHEVAALYGMVSVLNQEGEISEGLGLSERVKGRAHYLKAQMESFGFRAGRVLQHLSSFSSLATLCAGIFIGEMTPLLFLSRAGTSGRLWGGWVDGGMLTYRGAALSGVGTGLAMGTLGSILHNRERSALGFETHYGRDILWSSGINILTFGATLPCSRLFANRLAPTEWATRGVGELPFNRNLLHHGGTALFGGSIAYGLGLGARYLQTGEVHSSPEEAIENFAGIFMFEGISAQVRTRALATLPLGFEMGALGETRSGVVRRLAETMIHHNPSLETQQNFILRQLASVERRAPEELSGIQSALEHGDRPVVLERRSIWGRGMHRSLRILPKEIFSSRESRQATPLVREVFPPSLEPRSPLRLGPGTSAIEAAAPERPPNFVLRFESEDGDVLSGNHLSLKNFADGELVLGRSDFPFLRPELGLHLSREHFRLSREGDSLHIEDLSRNGTWVEERGPEELQWVPLRSRGRAPLRPGQRIALGRIYRSLRDPHETHLEFSREAHEPIASREADLRQALVLDLEISGREATSFQEPPTRASGIFPEGSVLRVALEPGQVRLFEGVRVIRDRESSIYRLAGGGGTQVELLREFGVDGERGLIQTYRGSDNPILGEIGEEIWLRMTQSDGTIVERNLVLEDPSGSARHLPEIRMYYEGVEKQLRFRSTQAEISVGRNLDTRFFGSYYISRNHFGLRIGSEGGNPRYFLTVQSRNGLVVEGVYFRQGQTLRALTAGVYSVEFPLSAGRPDAVGNVLRLELPPIRVSFPEWRLDSLLPHHDQASPPHDSPQAPSSPEAPSSSAPSTPASPSLLEKILNLFNPR